MNIKKLVFSALTIMVMNTCLANEVQVDPLSVDITDKPRLQRGARMFMNYCSGCHSLKYLRYNSMAQDLGLTTFDGKVDGDLLKNNLIFTNATPYDPINVAMAPEDAKQWFGIVPPDLSLVARSRGPGWVYAYLKGFYKDSKRPFGTNNILIPDVAMPNVLEPLLGNTILVENKEAHSAYLLVTEKGEMHQAQFNDALRDVVTFLVYVAEPARLVRYRIGVFVIGFLLILLVVSYNLKKVYWQRLK